MGNAKAPEIPLIRLRPDPIDDVGKAALGFKYAGEDIGYRHQLGGTPTWIQGDDTPECPHCHKTMSFYGQLDSIGDKYEIADCGIIYVFFCFDCNHAEANVQSF